MRRVLVLTWALGTATGVLLGLFGVQLVSSRFSTAGVSPMSRPEVLRALQAARSGPAGADEVAAPVTPPPDTALPPASPPVDVPPAPPAAGSASSPAPAAPPSTLPRPAATGGSFVQAAAVPAPQTSTTIVAASAPPPAPPAPPTTATTATESAKKNTGSRNPTTSTKKSTTTTTARKTSTTQAKPSGSGQQSADTRTVSSAGGVVGVRFSNGKVELKWARPNPGYQVYVENNGPDSVVVYFYTKSKLSRVRAYYNGGSPVTDVWEYAGRDPKGQM